jgi:hypothetical protein
LHFAFLYLSILAAHGQARTVHASPPLPSSPQCRICAQWA